MEPPLDILARLETLTRLAPSGFAMAMHVRFTTPTYLFQTYPKAWIEHYSRNGLVMRDPTVLWGFENAGLIQWRDLVGNDPHNVIAGAAAHGMKHGFTYVMDAGESRSLTSYTRPDRDFTADEIAVICAHADAIHTDTASPQALSARTRADLHRLSITFTHP